MWTWFRKKKKRCTAEDVRFLSLLCLGREPAEREFTSLIGKTAFRACRQLMEKREFRHTVTDPLTLGGKPLSQAFSSTQRKILHKGMKRHFHHDLPESDTHISILVDALNHPDIMNALTLAQPSLQPSWVKNQLIRAANSTPIPLQGLLETLTTNTITGYAFYPNDTDRALDLDFFVNGCFVGACRTTSIRRDIQEIHGGKGFYGFSHSYKLPAYLASHDTLILHVFDRATGQQVCPVQPFTPVTAKTVTHIQRLTAELVRTRQLLETQPTTDVTKDIFKSIQAIEEALPYLQSYAALPRECYSDHALLFRSPAPPSVPTDAPTAHIAATATEAITVKADLILICQHGEHLSPGAEAWVQTAAHENPEADLFFADHTRTLEAGAETTPVFRENFDPDILFSDPSYATAFAIRRSALERLKGLQQGMKSAIWYDLWLRLYAQKGAIAFHHIPAVLWHITAAPPLAGTEAENALKAFMAGFLPTVPTNTVTAPHTDRYGGNRPNMFDINWPLEESLPRLAIIIPTRDALGLLQACVRSLRETLAYPEHTEIIIVDNGSREAETRQWLREADNMDGIRVLVHDAPFNWSEINNRAVAETTADYLLFLNNDTVATTKGWDHVLRTQLNRADIGAVGARLLFEDGTIQYAGYILHPQNIVLKEAYSEPPTVGGYLGRSQLPHTTSAIIGAFLGCRRDVFTATGGFDSKRFAVAFNDVDFSLAVQKLGLRNLYCPAITFLHLESKSRGYDAQDAKKTARVERERAAMQAKWGQTLAKDPLYPPAFMKTEPTHMWLAAPAKDCI